MSAEIPLPRFPSDADRQTEGSTARAVPLELIRSTVVDSTGRGIATALSDLIQSGQLAFGTRLPSIRIIADTLHVSASTVSEAWQLLGRQGLIRASGRNGTVVLRRREIQLSDRSRQAHWMTGIYGTDLSSGTPDKALLPPLHGALRNIALTADVSNYNEPPTVPALADLMRSRWSGTLDPEQIMITDGAFDAIDRLLREHVRVGDNVLVESPTLPSLIDAIESNGGVPTPVELDDEGLSPESLIRALRTRPAMLIFQPRAQNPTGISTTPRRMRELGRILANSRVLVVEDDHMGAAASAPRVSMMPLNPDRTIYIEGFSKSYGPDLRLAAVGGPSHVLGGVNRRRRLGPAWSSRILQSLLYELLSDEAIDKSVAHARETYRRRRLALQQALERRGLRTTGTEGLNLWVEVRNETGTLKLLAAEDIGAAPGAPFFVSTTPVPYIRITCGVLDETDAERVADLIAARN